MALWVTISLWCGGSDARVDLQVSGDEEQEQVVFPLDVHLSCFGVEGQG